VDIDLSNKIPAPNRTEGSNGYALSFNNNNDTTVFRNFGVWGQAVPVTWLDFKATKFGPDAALLNWSTSQEENNDFFTVQHSVDGVNFTDIGVVKGAGNSASARHYEFIHADPIMGVNYYRIKQTDFNGSYDYTVVRTVNFGGPVGEVKVSPNPVESNAVVQIPETVTGEATVTIMDMSGKLYSTRIISEDEVIGGNALVDMSGLKSGAYLITIQTVDNVFTNRIIKK